jgi:hypothetical protein
MALAAAALPAPPQQLLAASASPPAAPPPPPAAASAPAVLGVTPCSDGSGSYEAGAAAAALALAQAAGASPAHSVPSTVLLSTEFERSTAGHDGMSHMGSTLYSAGLSRASTLHAPPPQPSEGSLEGSDRTAASPPEAGKSEPRGGGSGSGGAAAAAGDVGCSGQGGEVAVQGGEAADADAGLGPVGAQPRGRQGHMGAGAGVPCTVTWDSACTAEAPPPSSPTAPSGTEPTHGGSREGSGGGGGGGSGGLRASSRSRAQRLSLGRLQLIQDGYSRES